ncbi:hypothetical protein FH972_023182 [Carpinus fangiana]|uniref:3-hydroxyacyl-CoA dehydrogenase NAD binding domain-containing protein n=1 Tax=Carpinus fangiana TaxID=176857 RepID=A0A5N6KUE9_9ROSI|nr:hypothetical protein FH972_023182 [Carpinus fangiana]
MSYTLPSTIGRSVAVLGGGVLGRRIAAVYAAGGHNVNIRDPSEKQRNDAQRYVDENLEFYVKRTHIKPGTVRTFDDLIPAVKDAWLVVEVVPEKLSIKIDTFADLEKYAPKDAILCSNSSSYKSSEMLANVQDATKQRILNTHFMMPPQANVVELMTCGHTDPQIFPLLVKELKKSVMIPFVAKKESSGFIFNRIWAAIKREVLTVIDEGVADPEQIDAIWKEQYVNNPIGPCEMMDGVGLDTVSFIEQHYVQERGLSPTHTVDFLEREYISKGRLGTKSDKGGLYPAEHYEHDDIQGKPVNTKEPKLYFLDIGLEATQDPLHSGKVLVGDADGSNLKTLVDRQSLPDGLDIVDGRVYWTNMGIPNRNDGCVMSCALDGSDIQTVIPQGDVHTPKQLTISPKQKKLYFSDREGLRVHRANLDGSEHEILIRNGDFSDKDIQSDPTKWCVGITVDEETGYLYWTQKGPSKGFQGRLFRAPLASPHSPDNRSDIELLFEGLPEPIDLEVDHKGGYLYWTDRGDLPGGNSINRVSLTELDKGGKASDHKHEILARFLHEGIGIKLDPANGHMYVTDLGGSVYRFNLDGTGRVKMFEEQGVYTGITLLHPNTAQRA